MNTSRFAFLFAAIATALSLRADIVTLVDGRIVEGDIVAESPTDVTVKVAVGKSILKREEILKIERVKSPAVLIREKIEAFDKKKASVEDWLKLALEAKKVGAKDESFTIYKKVIALDNDNETAQTALGRVKVENRWVDNPDSDKPAKPRGIIVGKAVIDNDGVPAAAADGSNVTSKETLAKMAGVQGFAPEGERPVDCPNCHGTGIAITLECLSCNRSNKPGYRNYGDHYELCEKCNGLGKLVGLYCGLCNHTGKVLLSHITPANGGIKPAPAGYKWCPQCNATGYDSWLPCNQCKRSKYPGYAFFGDRLEVCNRCGGAGKLPGTVCSLCNKRCIVPDK